MIIPNIWENKQCSKPPTKLYLLVYNPTTQPKREIVVMFTNWTRFRTGAYIE